MVVKINNSPFFGMLTEKYGEKVDGPGRIRTCDQLVMSQSLHQTKLRAPQLLLSEETVYIF